MDARSPVTFRRFDASAGAPMAWTCREHLRFRVMKGTRAWRLRAIERFDTWPEDRRVPELVCQPERRNFDAPLVFIEPLAAPESATAFMTSAERQADSEPAGVLSIRPVTVSPGSFAINWRGAMIPRSSWSMRSASNNGNPSDRRRRRPVDDGGRRMSSSDAPTMLLPARR